MLNDVIHKPYSRKEKKILELATIGGLTDEEAYWKVYKPKDGKTGLTTLARKRKHRPELFAEIARYKKELFEAAARVQRETVQAIAVANALTAIEKREKLRKIIEGETEEEVLFHAAGKVMKAKKGPAVSDRIRAIDLDNKMAGHYAPTHLKHDGTDKFIEMMKTIRQKDSIDIESSRTSDKVNKIEQLSSTKNDDVQSSSSDSTEKSGLEK